MVPVRKAAIKARKFIRSITIPKSKRNAINARRVAREMKELSENDEYSILCWMAKDMALIGDNNGVTWTVCRSTNFKEPPTVCCLASSNFYEIEATIENMKNRWHSTYSSVDWLDMIRKRI